MAVALSGQGPRAAALPGRGRWRLKAELEGYAFLLPWLAGFLGLTLGPALASLYLSFTDFDLVRSPRWIGVANYARIATDDPKFAASMHVTFFYVAFAVPLKLAFALGVALILNKGIRGLPVYRALFYLPSLLGASVAIAVLWRQLFAGNGLVNQLLAPLGIHGPSWISNPDTSLYTLIALSVWQFGSPMIIFLAGLRQIPKDVYEAASIDGAGWWRRFWNITLPLLTPVVFFNAIVQTIDAFKAFTPASSSAPAPGGRSTRRSSTRSTSTRRPSPSSAWAMRRRSRGSW